MVYSILLNLFSGNNYCPMNTRDDVDPELLT